MAANRLQVEQLQGDLSSKDACITSQHQRIDKLTSELAHSQDQAESQTSVASQSSKDLTEARQEIVKLQTQIDSEKSESVKLTAALDVLVSSLIKQSSYIEDSPSRTKARRS